MEHKSPHISQASHVAYVVPGDLLSAWHAPQGQLMCVVHFLVPGASNNPIQSVFDAAESLGSAVNL